MSTSKCPKCSSTYFQLSENLPSGSNYKLQFVQCSACGSVVGVLEYFNNGVLLQEIKKKVEDFRCKASSNTDNNLQLINNNLIHFSNLVMKKLEEIESKINKE